MHYYIKSSISPLPSIEWDFVCFVHALVSHYSLLQVGVHAHVSGKTLLFYFASSKDGTEKAHCGFRG
jgi:hypothetical protein